MTDDRCFAFKTLDEVIETLDNSIVVSMEYWLDKRTHNSQIRYVWSNYLQCAEDCTQLKLWLMELKNNRKIIEEYENKYGYNEEIKKEVNQ